LKYLTRKGQGSISKLTKQKAIKTIYFLIDESFGKQKYSNLINLLKDAWKGKKGDCSLGWRCL
jgi:hypothetical protein